jgi:Raf kinase inhibitor-like YbhB/YbcL family protein
MSSLVRTCVAVAAVTLASLTALAQSSAPKSKMTVLSPAFQAGGKIPDQFTCKGSNINPALQFDGIPAGTKSLALVVDDPDAPEGLFSHWLLWNLDPTTTQIAEKSVPNGAVQGSNDFGKPGYSGPCPPSGTHRYFFRLFALDQKLNLKSGAKRHEVDKAIAGHVLGRGEIMGRYSK